MVYYGTETTERILLHSDCNTEDVHYISMTKLADVPTFVVNCCCDYEWEYEFYMDNNSDYERVKMMIMDVASEVDDIAELMDVLGGVFEDGFEDILVKHECNGDCEHCTRH